ncbi:hypothetical protein, partial [Microcoleus sp. herbarium5]|uniref:hypothetical protein n=1 Tax=Microcoleus sp. herbarium5 TaxID=3055434 RepID=UPI002FD2ABDB
MPTRFIRPDPRLIVHRPQPLLWNVDRPDASDSECWMGNIIKTHCYWRSKSGISILSPELSQPAIKVPTCGTLDQ